MSRTVSGDVPQAQFSHAFPMVAMPKRPGSSIPMPVFVQPNRQDAQSIPQTQRQ